MLFKIKRMLLIVMIMVITFCCGEIKAYYNFNKSGSINFTTAGYSDLTLTTDKSVYGLCSSDASVSLTVSNPNDYAVTYTIGFSNSALSYTIDGSTGASYTINSNGNKNHTIVLGGGTTNTSLTITVSPTGPYKSSHTKTITLDLSCPTSSVTSTNNVATSQTATISCSDTEGMASYYWGTSSSPATGDFTTLTANLSTTKTVSSAGTYYLICKDKNGNTSTTSKTFYKTTLTMTNGSVSPTSVITMSGNGFKLPTPTASTGYTAKGAWYTSTAYSTSKGNYGATYTPSSNATLYSTGVANTYTIAYTLNGGTAGTNAPTSGTYDSLVTIDNPSRSGYAFKGWTASNLTTGTAKHGTTTSPATAWDGTTKVTSKYFKNLRSTSGTVTLAASWEYTATFYYWDKTNSKIASTTATCTGTTSCNVTIPSAVTGSTGQYSGTYQGLATSVNSATASVASTTTTITLSANTNYYAIYRSNVTIYRPSSTTAVTSETWYRNDFFTSTSATTAILNASSTATTNGAITQVNGYTFYGFNTAANTQNLEYSSVADAATSSKTTLYAISRMSITGTIYYYDSGVKSTTASEYRYLYCKDTTTAVLKNSYYKIPTEVTESTGEYGGVYVGANKSLSNKTLYYYPDTSSSTIYAFYQSEVTIYYPTSTSAVSSETWYRNEYFTSTSAMNAVLSTGKSGQSNTNGVSDIYGIYQGLATAVNSTSTITIEAAAKRTETTYYAVSTTSITATFYYYNSGITSTTANGTRTNYCKSTSAATTSAGSIIAPVTITNLTSQYGTTGIGWATTTGTMSTTSPTTANTTYYAVYRKNVKVYYPTSTSALATVTWYRNAFFTSTSAMNTVLSATNTGTSNATTVSGIYGTYQGLATTANSTSTITIAAAATRTETTYYAVSTSSITSTFYYWDTTNSEIISKTASGTRTNYCKSTSAATTSDGAITAPVTITNLTSQYGATGIGWATTTGTMSTTNPTTANTTYYAVYRTNVTEYFSTTSTQVNSRTLYRNAFFTSTGAMSTILSTSTTGTSNASAGSTTGYYSTTWLGYGTQLNSMNVTYSSVSAAATSTSIVLYSIYRTDVTIYFPTYSGTSSVTAYRNMYFTSTSAMNTVLTTDLTSTGTTNLISLNGQFGNIKGLALSLNSTDTITAEAAAVRTETIYYVVTAVEQIMTFYYQSSAIAGTCNIASTTTTGNQLYYCETLTTRGTYYENVSIPSVVSESVGQYNSAYVGVGTSPTTMTTTSVTTANATYYAKYRTNVTNYYYYNGSYTSRTLYRNEQVSNSACDLPSLSTTTTAMGYYSPELGPGNSHWAGFATSATTTAEYSTLASAAQSTVTTLYTIYQLNVIYSKGSNVSAIGATAGSCKLTTSSTSCTVTLPTITANTGYTSVGWSTTSGATSGTAAGNSYTVSSTGTVLYGNAKANSYKLVQVPNNNLLNNGDFESYTISNPTTPTGSTHTWDTELNGIPGNTSKAYYMTSWGTGANMGVPVPEVGYHAHMRIIDNNNVLRFKTNEDYAGNTGSDVSGGTVVAGTVKTNRWLGTSQAITGTKLKAGATYVVTMDVYRVSGSTYATGGLYYATNANTTKSFKSGQFSFAPTKTGEWQTLSWTFTLSEDYKSSVTPAFYIYGYSGAPGELYVDNVRLEETITPIDKTYNTAYTSTDLSSPTKTGYTFAGWYNDEALTTALSTSNTFNTSTATFDNIATPGSIAKIYAKLTANTYTIGYTLNGGTAGTNKPTSGTYDSLVTIDNPTKSGATFAGWTASGLDAETAKHGATSPDTNWDGTTEVTSTYFKNLRSTSGTVYLKANWEYTATFYYWDSTNSKIASTTATCTGTTSCSITIPEVVTGSTGQYGNAYAGLATDLSSMTTTINSSSTSRTLSENKVYYAIYRTAVNIYRPYNASKVTSTTLYRNSYFTSTSSLSTILGNSTTSTTNETSISQPSNYSFYGLATSANTRTRTYATIASAAASTSTTLYGISSLTSTGTFYYYSSGIKSTTATATGYLYCASTSDVKIENVNYTIPTAVTGSTGQYGGAYVGLATSTETMESATTVSTSVMSLTQTFYAVYRTNVTIYYPSSASAVSNTTWYRNAYFSSTSAMTTILSSSSTGTSNSTAISGIVGTYKGLSTAVNSTSTITIAAAATRTETKYYAVSTQTNGATFRWWDTANSNVASEYVTGTDTYYCKTTSSVGLNVGSLTAPVTITDTTYYYGENGIGWATATGTMTTTTSLTTANDNYYGVYRDSVKIYYPTSTSAVSSVTWYRNAYYSSPTSMSSNLSTSSTGTSNATTVSGIYGTYKGLATSVNSTSTITIAAAVTRTETTYYAVSTSSITATFYYQSSATAGTCSVKSATNSATRTNYCKSTSAATTTTENISIPSAVSGSVGKYNSEYVGVATATGTMTSSTSATTANTVYYAVYTTRISDYYYDSESTYRILYRNEWLTSTSACGTPVLSASETGTTNASTTAGPGGSVWVGFGNNDYFGHTVTDEAIQYSSMSAAAQSTETAFYSVYQFNVTYSKGSNVSAIGATSGNCKIFYFDTSCNVTLPTITANTGYTAVGWSTTSGSSSGTAAGSSYTLSSNATTLYANAKDKTAPVIVSITSTSDTATSQTVTIKCSDDVGVTKYYWGQVYSPAASLYKSVTSATEMTTTVTALSEGMFNLYCRDAAGNVSTVTQATFYMTEFEVENGTVSVPYVISMAGNKFTLPTPTANTGYSIPSDGAWNNNSVYAFGASASPGSRTLSYSATPNNYTVTFDGNTFSPPTKQTVSGLTFTYDPTTSYLTIDGEPTAHSVTMSYDEFTFAPGDQYRVTLEYVSGTYSGGRWQHNITIRDANKNIVNNNISTGNTYPLTAGTPSNTMTVTEEGAAEGVYFCNWIYFGNNYSLASFDNYTVKVNVTFVESKTVTFGEQYGELGTTPKRAGFEFAGWYTAETGGTQVTGGTLVSTPKDHTLYAHWVSATAEVSDELSLVNLNNSIFNRGAGKNMFGSGNIYITIMNLLKILTQIVLCIVIYIDTTKTKYKIRNGTILELNLKNER